jgi:hypothetical protein
MLLGALSEIQSRQAEFFSWMDKELNKIESFYELKEDEASERLKVLREQLHEMRDRRLQEVIEAQRAKEGGQDGEDNEMSQDKGSSPNDFKATTMPRSTPGWLKPIERVIDNVRGVPGAHPGKNTRALQEMHSRSFPKKSPLNLRLDAQRDFVRKPAPDDGVHYRFAKRKLKLALQEYYRGLELLKAYALLNRTAFRKINKKYDKAVNAHPPGRYMSEKVNKAYFVQSEVLDGLLHTVEDLYARYFERGNHKVAVGKLRSNIGKRSDFSGSVFRNGLMIGIACVFAVQGIIYAVRLLRHPDATIRSQTSYLLQVRRCSNWQECY